MIVLRIVKFLKMPLVFFLDSREIGVPNAVILWTNLGLIYDS